MDEKNSLRVKVIIGVVVALVVCALVPYEHWDADIVSGRLVSEGTIVERGNDAITVRLYTMSPTDDMVETDTFLVLEGTVPDDAHLGQRVRIGYSSSGGLYENPNQTVQVSYFVRDNLLVGFVLDMLIPFQSTETDLRVADIQSDGSLLVYNMAA